MPEFPVPPRPKGMSDETYQELLKEQSMLDQHMGVHIPLADFDEIDEADPTDW